jgi:DNA-binding MarR family transcriptional regulator
MKRDVREFRRRIQDFVRIWGLLNEDQTPCKQPVSTREAHALLVLRELDERGVRPRHGELQKLLGIDKSNVTRLVQRLEESDWVSQSPANDDGRSRVMSLTPKGRRLGDRLDQTSLDRFSALVAAIPENRRTAVLESLALLEEAARALGG